MICSQLVKDLVYYRESPVLCQIIFDGSEALRN